MSQVRITNISHQNQDAPGKGFGCWFSDHFMKPGDSILIEAKDLPHDWKRLVNIFKFEEMNVSIFKEQETVATASILEQLLNQQGQLLKQMQTMQTKLDEQPAIQVVTVQGSHPSLPMAPNLGPAISQEVFVSDIGNVESSDIKLESIESKGSSLSDVKAKLAKNKKKKEN